MSKNPVVLFASLVLTGISLLSVASAAVLPVHKPVPGGVAVINFNSDASQRPIVTYLKNRVLVRKNKDHWQAIVGIPLSAKAGIHKVRVTAAGKSFHKEFSVSSKQYETRHITISNKRMVSPTAEDIKRHRGEKKLIIKAINTWNEVDEVQTTFIMPVNGRLSSQFGLRRIYNNQKRIRRHTGLDIAAPVGTKIVAPAQGKVISTGNYFFTGNTVFIDHGQGLLTMYSHLSKTGVKPGDVVNQGQYIGDIGMTGRVSGPHLHWTIFLNRTKVEPLLFMQAK